MRVKIPLYVTIEQRNRAYYVMACHVDLGQGPTRLDPPARQFVSSSAAVNGVKRIVLRHLQRQGRVETGADIECTVDHHTRQAKTQKTLIGKQRQGHDSQMIHRGV